MPRTRQFNIEDALSKAMYQFWRHGYRATSMKDLVECMGIGRASLYNTFGNKHALLLRTLHLYLYNQRQDVARLSVRSDSPRAAIMHLFEAAISAAVDEGCRDGCFLINIALEFAPDDPEVGETVAGALRDKEEAFHTLIGRGQAAGEIRRDMDSDHVARSLLSLLVAVQVLARSCPEAPLLRAIKEQVEALL